MRGAESAAGIDLDRSLRNDQRAVVAAVNDETPCPHRRQRLLRLAHPVGVGDHLDRDRGDLQRRALKQACGVFRQSALVITLDEPMVAILATDERIVFKARRFADERARLGGLFLGRKSEHCLSG